MTENNKEKSIRLAEEVSGLLEDSEGVENMDLKLSNRDNRHGMTFDYQDNAYGVTVKLGRGNSDNWVKVFPVDDIKRSERDQVDLTLSREGDSRSRYFGRDAEQLANEAYRLVSNNAAAEYSSEIRP